MAHLSPGSTHSNRASKQEGSGNGELGLALIMERSPVEPIRLSQGAPWSGR
jgi:hypothetical protein